MKAADGTFMRFEGSRRGWLPRPLQDDCVEHLLCGDCEHRLHKCENSVARFLAGGLLDNLVPAHGKHYTFVNLPDYTTVKLYLLSLLWRCHAARAPAFRFVDLGPKHDARLREMLLTADPGEPWEYGCFISTVHLNLEDGKFDRPPIGFMPEAMRFEGEHGLHIVRMVIDGIVLHFVVGSPERMKAWRGSPMFPQRDGRTVVGVDDGMNMPFFRDQLRYVFESENPVWDRRSP